LREAKANSSTHNFTTSATTSSAKL